jgi:hypothetical protein
MVRVMILASAEMGQATSLTMTIAALQATTTALAPGRWRCGAKYTFLADAAPSQTQLVAGLALRRRDPDHLRRPF